MRSVDVVFPASICAMIPMLRVSSSLNALPMVPETALLSPARVATASLTSIPNPLPTVMREGLVGLRHAVHVFFFLDRPAARVGGVNQLIREFVGHRLARAFSRILQQPANRQRLPPKRVHFHRNLVVRAAHAPRFHFQHRLHVFHGLLENLQRIIVRFLRHLVHRAVKHALRRGFLAFPHHRADELLHQVVPVDRIGRLRPPKYKSFAWHWAASPRTWIVPACGSPRPRRPVFRARCDSARPANPSRGRRARARWSAPASCGRCRECRSSLQPHSSAARAPLSAAPNLVSSASVCTRECTRPASPGSPRARATSSSSGPLHGPFLRVAKTSAQSSLNCARKFSRLPQRAHTISRKRSPVLKGLLRIRRYNQQETPYALQEAEHFSWLQFGEAYSALRGWRPIPAALLSHSVLLCSGTEDKSLPTQRLRTSWSRPTQGKSIPDKHQSIGKKTRPVKSFDTSRWKTLCNSGALAPALPPDGSSCRSYPDSLLYSAPSGWAPNHLLKQSQANPSALDESTFHYKPFICL